LEEEGRRGGVAIPAGRGMATGRERAFAKENARQRACVRRNAQFSVRGRERSNASVVLEGGDGAEKAVRTLYRRKGWRRMEGLYLS